MSSEQPFHHLFESLGRLPQSHADAINRHAYQALLDTLSVPLDHAGRCILLRAPRAGHGKTHLLSRIQHHLAPGHEFIPLQPASGCRIDAASVTDDALRRIGRPLPAAGGLCGLDLIVRRLYSLALQPLVSSGEVPCIDRDGALASLRNRPLETFDFQHPSAVTAHWIRDNFEVLGPRLALELSHLTGVPPRAIGFWVEAMFHFAVTPTDIPGRVDSLAIAAFSAGSGDGVAMERLSALLALLSLLMRVVLVADDLEGFSADETAALRLAAFLGSLRHSAERLDVILSLNQDIWESAFVPRLSGGLADRLSEIVIELEPLTSEQMIALLESRVPGLGVRVLEYMRAEGLETHARGVLRAAAAAWSRASRQPADRPAAPPAFEAPPPPMAAVPAVFQTPAVEPPSPPAPAPEVAVPAEVKPPEPVEIPAPEPIVEPPAAVVAPPVCEEPPAAAAQAHPQVVDSPFHVLAAEPAPQPVGASEPPSVFQPEPVASPVPAPVPQAVEPAAAAPEIVSFMASVPIAAPVAPPVFEETSWSPPAPPVAEPPTSPFQPSPAPAWQPPALHETQVPPPPAPEPPVFQPAPVPVPAPQPEPPVFQPVAAPPVWQPPVYQDAPVSPPPAPEPPVFQSAPEPAPAPQPEPPVFQPAAAPPVWQPPVYQDAPVSPPPAPEPPAFQPAPAIPASPFQIIAPAPAWPVPANPPIAPPDAPAQAVFTPPVQATFTPPPQATFAPPAWQPAPAPEPPVAAPPPQFAGVGGAPTPAAWQEATAPTSPFGTPAPVAPPQAPPAVPAETQAPIDQDRVEDLLRQFRERYSRPNP